MKLNIKSKLLLSILPAVFIILLVAIIIIAVETTQSVKDMAFNQTRYISKNYSNQFAIQSARHMQIAKTLAQSLERFSTLNRTEMNRALKNILEQNPDILGAYVGYEPNAYDGRDANFRGRPGHDNTGRFVPYWNRLTGTIKLDPLVDYETSNYYTVPRKTKKPFITEPYLYQGAMLLSYVVPIIKNNKFVGIAGIDVSLSKLNALVKKIRAFKTGYGVLISKKGLFISASKTEWIGKKTLKQLGTETNNPGLIKIADDILNGRSGRVSMTDPATGREIVSFYESIPLTKWGFVIAAPVDEMLAAVSKIQLILIIIGVVIISVISFAVFYISSKISKPIQSIADTLQHISQKDLTVSILKEHMARGDEIGILANSLNVMKNSLTEIIHDLSDVASNMAASSEEIASTAHNLADGAQTQSASVEQTSASMEELNSSAVQVSSNADDIKNKTSELFHTAQENSNLVSNAVSSMEKIKESSTLISEILNVINDISDQTNLLALNAAIEAARAGEHGRGFAVVADEISKLAEKSTENSKEIEKLIKKSIVDVDAGSNVVKKSGHAFNSIISGVEENSKLVEEITRAVDQQQKGSQEVQTAIENISDITQSNSASAEEMAASTTELQDQAEKIKFLIDQFKISENMKAITEQKKEVAVYTESLEESETEETTEIQE